MIPSILRTPLLAGLVLAGCGSPHRPDDLMPLNTPAQDTTILAFVNGEPVTRVQVAERARTWHESEYLEEYILWRLRELKIRELKIANTPEEVQTRARVEVERMRQEQGEENFRKFLESQHLTEDKLVRWWMEGGIIDQKLTTEKMVAYALVTEETLELDVLQFPRDRKSEAEKVSQTPSEFDTVRDTVEEHPQAVHSLSFDPFPKGMAPEFIDKTAEETIFSMAAGGVSTVISTPAYHYVVRVRTHTQGHPAPFAEVRESVMKRILEKPLDADQVRRWFQRLRRTGDVKVKQHEDRGPEGK